MSYTFLLDTNIIAALAKNPCGDIKDKISSVGQDTICTSIIVDCEIQYGLLKRGSARLTAQMSAILEAIDVLNLPVDIAKDYGDIRAHLNKQGRPIGPNDLIIAAHARAADLTVVTANDREFSRVPNLNVENWLSA